MVCPESFLCRGSLKEDPTDKHGGTISPKLPVLIEMRLQWTESRNRKVLSISGKAPLASEHDPRLMIIMEKQSPRT